MVVFCGTIAVINPLFLPNTDITPEESPYFPQWAEKFKGIVEGRLG